ncbi:MAG: hypothetical protein LBI84_11010 [Propionibacteriaceae bacterium]|nr:hypothetical protein [Propionibacteriaceae bacterium]
MRLTGLVVALTALSCLTACSGEADDRAVTPTLSLEVPAVDESAVDFTGPWANEFRRAYEKASDPLARSILRDGKVTEEEAAQTGVSFQGCLEGVGFTGVVIEDDGSMTVVPPPAMKDDFEAYNSLVQECDGGWRDIFYLYSYVKGNPDNVDVAQIMAECLVRIGLRPAGYTAADYWSDFSGDALDYPWGSPEELMFRACNSDPAHAG